jgi:small-conductance mechanosensitive channel
VTALLRSTVVEYLPKVILATLVLVIAAVIADAMKKIVTTASNAAHIRSAKTLGSFVKYVIWVFAVLIALTELGIASTLIYILLVGVVGMFAVGGAIAIGIGSKDVAGEMITKLRDEFRPKM